MSKDITLSEMITKIGDKNVQFQNLDNDILRMRRRADGNNEITFGTSANTTVSGTEKLGLVVWLDRKDVEKVTGVKV